MTARKGKLKLMVLAILLIMAAGGVVAYTQLIHVVHIEINPSGKTKVWEENTSEYPIPTIVTPHCESKQMAKKLFGKENPTLLDTVMKILEMPEGKRKVKELVNYYGRIFFSIIAYSLNDCSINVYTSPLTRPQEPVKFVFHYNKSVDNFSLEVVENTEASKWQCRNTDEELNTLLSVHDISTYNNTFFIACDSDYFAALLSKGFAWENEGIDLSGFKAYKGVQVSIAYQDGKELDRGIDEIMVIE
jgi:hypothetical protein